MSYMYIWANRNKLYKEWEVERRLDEKHGYSLLIGDHMFDRFRVNKSKTGTINSINYLCQSRLHGCNASITIKNWFKTFKWSIDAKKIKEGVQIQTLSGTYEKLWEFEFKL